MKKSILIGLVFSLLSLSLFAQNNIQLKINHKLGSSLFDTEVSAKNNLDHDFEITRLEYYISEIEITHDGGMVTPINDFWILMDAGKSLQEDLGDHDINTIEKISFYIGVDPDHNHLDPATYPESHPLAPQFPSMHWGWAAGYRFVALEGYGGSNFNQTIQLHGLGGINYFQTEVDLDLTADNNEIIIYLDADYTKALEDIEVNTGVIIHGDNLEAKQCLENFRDYVFTAGVAISSTIDFSEVSSFEVFPNPAKGNVIIALESSKDLDYAVSVTNILGKQIQFFDNVHSHSSIDLTLTDAGVYFINLVKEGHPVISKKLISK